VHLEPFRVYGTNDTYLVLFNTSDGYLMSNLTMLLHTRNCLSQRFPNENSGLKAFHDKGPRDLTILPSFESPAAGRPDLITPSLRRIDGNPFSVVLRAGTKGYYEKKMILSSQHTLRSVEKNHANQEANALGCVE
jgi:hypothetical protein